MIEKRYETLIVVMWTYILGIVVWTSILYVRATESYDLEVIYIYGGTALIIYLILYLVKLVENGFRVRGQKR